MLIIPAIDLKNGAVVRLYKGEESKATVYSDDPVEVARQWQRQGAQLLHLVDLDGAFSGSPKNLESVKNITDKVVVPVEFGGGVRSLESLERVLEAGAQRVVIGTIAEERPDVFKQILERYRQKIIVSADVDKQGNVLVKGWVKGSEAGKGLADMAKKLSELGIKQMIYTDTSRDGTLHGPRFNTLLEYLEIFKRYNISVIIAGGVSALEDIAYLKSISSRYQGLAGVIIGKALYEKRFTLKEALEVKPKEVGDVQV